jgi:cation diffusion facilitator family transporter
MTQAKSTKNQRVSQGIQVTIVGIVVNMILAATKGISGVLGNSYALIADAVESSLDVFSSIVVWGGLKIAAIPPDKNHPYGHGKAEPLAAMMVAIALMSAAVMLAAGSLHEIFVPRYAPAPFTLLVLVAVIIIKELLFRFVFKTGEEVGSTVVKTDAWHHRSDALTSLAAFIGISIALIGGKGYESADDWAALVASGVILFNAYRLFRPALDEIMDARPSPQLEKEIRKTALTIEGVVGTDTCHIRKMGLEYYVDLHINVDRGISVLKGHQIAHMVKDVIRHSNPLIADVIIHVEPDDHS